MRILFTISFTLCILFAFSQGNSRPNRDGRTIDRQTILGIQISPIVPTNFLQKSDYKFESDSVNYSINNQTSFSYGVEIRHYFTYRFALNTGILYTKRNIKVDYESTYPVSSQGTDTTFTGDLRFTAFEIPIKASGYVRLLENVYMSIAGGINLNFYPSDIRIENVSIQRFGNYGHNFFQFFQLGYSASLGWEYRTKDSGIFYLGANYQVRADEMAYVLFYEEETIHRADYFKSIKGSYFSIDFKYFFPINEKKRR